MTVTTEGKDMNRTEIRLGDTRCLPLLCSHFQVCPVSRNAAQERTGRLVAPKFPTETNKNPPNKFTNDL